MLKWLIRRPALVDEAPEQMGEVDVEWVYEDPRFIPKYYGLLLGKRPTHANFVTVGDEDEAAVRELA